jgi:hypothetical protein
VTPPDDLLFNPASADWVMVDGAGFVFEPWGAEFTPPERGRVLVAFGHDETRHRGVEVSQADDGWVSIWMPAGSQAYWLSDVSRDSASWETHLVGLDHERGALR